MSMSHGQLVRSGLARQAQAEVESVRAIDKLSTAAGLAQASEAASSGAMANIPSLPGGLSSLSAPVGDASSASLQMGQVGALGQTGQTSSSSASPPASQSPMQASLATPIDSPEFHGALGAQVAMMATGGVQMAQLQLNPAEMGPISIQIELEGEEARVEFGADSAATRQIIEAGLPALAAALSEAGLTLSGGGVSQQTPQNPSSAQAFGQEMPHPGGQQGSGGSSHGQERSDRGGSARSEPAPAAAARGRTKGSSGLDLFA
jgi:flagellar hook-length control protein FliK